jgi:hypothetical protein
MGVWARKFQFSSRPPPCTPLFNSSWCYIIINEYMIDYWWYLVRKMGLSAESATKNRIWAFLETSGEMGLNPAQEVDTLAGRRVTSTPRKRLVEPHTRRVSARSWPTLKHEYFWQEVIKSMIIHRVWTCIPANPYNLYLGSARTVYIRRVWPYIQSNPCQK